MWGWKISGNRDGDPFKFDSQEDYTGQTQTWRNMYTIAHMSACKWCMQVYPSHLVAMKGMWTSVLYCAIPIPCPPQLTLMSNTSWIHQSLQTKPNGQRMISFWALTCGRSLSSRGWIFPVEQHLQLCLIENLFEPMWGDIACHGGGLFSANL